MSWSPEQSEFYVRRRSDTGYSQSEIISLEGSWRACISLWSTTRIQRIPFKSLLRSIFRMCLVPLTIRDSCNWLATKAKQYCATLHISPRLPTTSERLSRYPTGPSKESPPMYSHLTVFFFGCVNCFEEFLLHTIQLFSN
jgi:hypothetical protein